MYSAVDIQIISGAHYYSRSFYAAIFCEIYPSLCLYNTHVSLLCKDINPNENLHIDTHYMAQNYINTHDILHIDTHKIIRCTAGVP